MHIWADVSFRVLQDDLPADDPRKQCPDISLAQKELQWTPTVNLYQGLQLTYEHLRQEIGNYRNIYKYVYGQC